MSEKPADPPSPVAIARALSGMTAAFAEDINFESQCLKEVHRCLNDEPPNIAEARAELAEGMAHAFRLHWSEDGRPSTWLVAACAHLLSAA